MEYFRNNRSEKFANVFRLFVKSQKMKNWAIHISDQFHPARYNYSSLSKKKSLCMETKNGIFMIGKKNTFFGRLHRLVEYIHLGHKSLMLINVDWNISFKRKCTPLVYQSTPRVYHYTPLVYPYTPLVYPHTPLVYQYTPCIPLYTPCIPLYGAYRFSIETTVFNIKRQASIPELQQLLLI